MHAAGWHSHLGRCPTVEAHAAGISRLHLPAQLRGRKKLRELHTLPHAIDPDLFDYVVAGQAALTTAGLMLASAALGVAGGSRLSPADPEDAIDVHSVPGNPNKALHMPAPSTFADSDASSNKSIGSRRFASVQNTGAKTLQRAEDGSAIGSSQHARNDSSSILSAEQLWEGAWKAFEEPVPGQGLPDTESPQIALARAQQLDSQHRSSFPSLAARFFRQGHPSGAQNRRHRRAEQGESQEQIRQPNQDAWTKPHLALQGIAPAARVRLLACALASIEKQILVLPEALDKASPEQWRLATQAIAASCAVTSARAWMGYIPQGLVEDAQDALQQLASDEISAGDPQMPAASGTCSSLGQLLTKALPSEVQASLKSSSQPTQSNKSRAADKEPQELTPLEALQVEKARIHGALVSYLKCGWQAQRAVQPGMTQSPREGSDGRNMTSSQSSASTEQRDVGVPGGSAELDTTSVGQQQQQQQTSMANEVSLGNSRASNDEQNPGSSGLERQRCRRAEAMAALEGRQHAMSSGSRAQAGAVQQMPMVLRCGAAVLQDLAVAVADAAADAYLADAGVSKGGGSWRSRDPGLAADTWLLVLHPRLTTTRSLERFRNQVALQRWLEANFGSVAAMYEDRHLLWGFNHKGRLLQRSLPARRAQELGGLTGLRYYYSTALEALDFFAPLLERLFSRIGDAVSWLLVRLIGRSLGLVYRGVRESLVPRQRTPVTKSRNPPKWAAL